MSDRILFMAGDYEAQKFCQKYYTQSRIQNQLYRHFIYSFLISDSLLMPAGCYFESDYTKNLVNRYRSLFQAYGDKRPIAGLAIGEDRNSFLDDVKIKASWYPKEYSLSDEERAIELSKSIEDIIPIKRKGKMRKELTGNVLCDIAPTGKSFQTLHESGWTIEETKNLLSPLEIVVNEQKYAILPPYTLMEMEKQRERVNKCLQKTWLDFILFKNYAISCEVSYDAYCNNPLSIWYDDLFKSLYSFRVDYRDTLLFEIFLSVFPINELGNLNKLTIEKLFEIKYSRRFALYLRCYKQTVKRIQEKLSIYISDLNYQRTIEIMDEEQRKERCSFKRIVAVQNILESEILYSALHKTFQTQKQRVNEFRKWLSGQDIDLPLISIMEVIDDSKNGICSSFVSELAKITKISHNKGKKAVGKNVMINIFSSGNKMTNSIESNSNQSGRVNNKLIKKGDAMSKETDDTHDEMIKKRFAVALSFPGEYRYFVGKVAKGLGEAFGRERILYDEYHMAEFSRPNLDIYLQNVYSKQAELIAVFLCEKYNIKTWCGVEWRSIRTLLNDKSTADRIMLIKIAPGTVDGVFGTVDGFLPADCMTESAVASAIIERYKLTRF